jgi:hypothetical protein
LLLQNIIISSSSSSKMRVAVMIAVDKDLPMSSYIIQNLK